VGAISALGDLFVAGNSTHSIYKVAMATLAVSTVASAPQVGVPCALAVDGAVFHGPILVTDFDPAGEILAVEQRHPLFVGEQVGFVLGSLCQEDHRQREYYHQSSHHHWFYHKKRCRAEWKPDLFFAPPWKNSVTCPNARA